jgi:hypothetical protein
MDTANLTKLAIAGGIIFAAIKFAPNALVKAGAAGVAAMIVAKQIPYVQDVL